MGKLNTSHLLQCIKTLESSLERLNAAEPESIDYEIFRNATIKGFELTLETTGKLLRKTLKSYMGNPRTADELTYKDLFRHASKHGFLDTSTVERWFSYRDNRNNTAHDYGVAFAQTTLKLLPKFLEDAKTLQQTLQKNLGSDDVNP
jgi:nucleotidyltransferase substrate binding protein (TIGR01987 family)